MSKHTPGPWKAVAYPAGKEIGFATHEIQYGNDGECVAEVVHGEANARLIAAAPDLLEVCQTFPGFNTLSHNPDAIANWVVKLNEAIAKATNQNQEA